jgi:hypothetical protein
MTSRLITSCTLVLNGLPSATTRTAMSRSVIVPSTFSESSQTGRNPMFSSFIWRAAS